MSGRVFFYAELKAATKEFNCRNFLGQGGSCCKTAGPERRGEAGLGIKEFDTEIVMMGRLRHPNLVSLVSYCQLEDERLLVYEYMLDGRLGEHIFYVWITSMGLLSIAKATTVKLPIQNRLELECMEVVVKRLVQNGEEKQDKESKNLTRRLLFWDVSDIPIWCRWWATTNMKMKGCWCTNTCRAAALENIFLVQNNET
uniref:Serine-threonine/tyrosine-protein kinase catalytic domain-containing protein n=1 Tax=Lactuca sativa TaxID=4236 RepID=A0A9R1XCN5_LACSA|nr:hypothetical protein LSAT_V11C500249980 [Lactuca sativa]